MTIQQPWQRSQWTDGHMGVDLAGDGLAGPPPRPAFLTVQEVAELLRVSPATVRAWIAKGEGPPALRFGKQIRYRPERVMEWVEEQEGGGR